MHLPLFLRSWFWLCVSTTSLTHGPASFLHYAHRVRHMDLCRLSGPQDLAMLHLDKAFRQGEFLGEMGMDECGTRDHFICVHLSMFVCQHRCLPDWMGRTAVPYVPTLMSGCALWSNWKWWGQQARRWWWRRRRQQKTTVEVCLWNIVLNCFFFFFFCVLFCLMTTKKKQTKFSSTQACGKRKGMGSKIGAFGECVVARDSVKWSGPSLLISFSAFKWHLEPGDAKCSLCFCAFMAFNYTNKLRARDWTEVNLF